MGLGLWGSLAEWGATARQHPLRRGHLVALTWGWWHHRLGFSVPVCKMGATVPTLWECLTTRRGEGLSWPGPRGGVRREGGRKGQREKQQNNNKGFISCYRIAISASFPPRLHFRLSLRVPGSLLCL